jgi:hypothetical protein
MKNAYRLNLPPLDQVIRDDAKHLCEDYLTITSLQYTEHSAQDVVKPEWLTFENFKWNTVLRFYKPPGCVGRIHTDTRGNDPRSAHTWGINWIWGGSGTLRFWSVDDIGAPIPRIDPYGYHTYVYDNAPEPSEIIHMEPGAYLINAAVPHQPTSLGERYCFSLRSSSSYNIPWDLIVDKFSKYIVDTI